MALHVLAGVDELEEQIAAARDDRQISGRAARQPMACRRPLTNAAFQNVQHPHSQALWTLSPAHERAPTALRGMKSAIHALDQRAICMPLADQC